MFVHVCLCYLVLTHQVLWKLGGKVDIWDLHLWTGRGRAGLGRGRSWTVIRAQQNPGPSGKKVVLRQTEMIGHYTPTWFSHLTQAALERARPATEDAVLQLKETLKELIAGGSGLTAFPAARRQALPWRGTGWCISLPTMLPNLSIVNTVFILFSFNKQKVLPFHIFGVEFEITITISIPWIIRWSILYFWAGWN